MIGIGALLGCWALSLGTHLAQAADSQENLRQAVANSLPQLGLTEPWQKRLFDLEVVPFYQRFIKDYRVSEGKTNAQLDLEAIKSFTRFYAPSALRKPNPTALVFLQAEPGCDKCENALPTLKKMVTERLQRRGFALQWATPIEMGAAGSNPAQLEERLQLLAAQKDFSGAVLLSWGNAPADTLDSVHADEKNYQIQLLVLVRASAGSPTPERPEYRTQGKLSVLANDSFETAGGRLMTDAWTTLGSETVLASLLPVDTGKGEPWIELTGLSSYEDYARVKGQLQTQLGDRGTLEERKMSRGKVTLAVRTRLAASEISRQLSKADLGNGIQMKVMESP